MEQQLVNLNVSDGIGHLELNRPQAANSINMGLAQALCDAATSLINNEAVRAVLITGAGARFCAGGDVSAFASSTNQQQFLTDLATSADAAVQILENLPVPVVAAVQGSVAGAGLGIMLAADVIISAEDTKFVFAYPSVGLTPDCGTSVSLPRAMGLQRALAFALSGRPLSAKNALEQGLVTELTKTPLDRAQKIAATWASSSPEALGATRQLLRQNVDIAREKAGQREATAIGQRVVSSEAQDLVQSFVSR
jgi:2-(1,2-epoxy-1,2-dihydrophenyl)acetyl-CoA isomerase